MKKTVKMKKQEMKFYKVKLMEVDERKVAAKHKNAGTS